MEPNSHFNRCSHHSKFFVATLIVMALSNIGCNRAEMRMVGPGPLDPPGGKVECKETDVRRLTLWSGQTQGDSLVADQQISVLGIVDGDRKAQENYNYNQSNLSAQIVNGPSGRTQHSTHFFYRDSQGLNLFLLFDNRGFGLEGNEVELDVRVIGNQRVDQVVQADEPGDIYENAELLLWDHGADSNYYRGRFAYIDQTDGGVIGPLVTDHFQIHMTYRRLKGLLSHLFFNVARELLTLEASDKPQSFVIQWRTVRECI